MISIIENKSLCYPSDRFYFSPSEVYSEFENPFLSSEENRIYAAVRKCLIQAGLDESHQGTSEWNPLGDYIKPGQKVFVLCNFVQEVSSYRGGATIESKCTHASVVRPVIDYVLKALKGSGLVRFGNAPIQDCDWSKVTQQSGAAALVRYYQQKLTQGPDVELVDLRQHVLQRNILGTAKDSRTVYKEDELVKVDLGESSLLDVFCKGSKAAHFRILDYDSQRINECHQPGKHVYLVSRHVLESDVIISIPKLKTHEKVGITCGLKGCVGSVVLKDCLAHHRFGPPRRGGDEYPDRLAFFRVLSSLHDKANSAEKGVRKSFLNGIDNYSRKIVRRMTRSLSGGWPGNDTCWRMALDLARILSFASECGTMRRLPQRKHLMITDGVVAGEGNGPLSATPTQRGYIAFSDDLALGDYANCIAMGFDPDKIPLVREALRLDDFPLTEKQPLAESVVFNGKGTSLAELSSKFAHPMEPPREWKNLLLSRTRANTLAA